MNIRMMVTISESERLMKELRKHYAIEQVKAIKKYEAGGMPLIHPHIHPFNLNDSSRLEQWLALALLTGRLFEALRSSL